MAGHSWLRHLNHWEAPDPIEAEYRADEQRRAAEERQKQEARASGLAKLTKEECDLLGIWPHELTAAEGKCTRCDGYGSTPHAEGWRHCTACNGTGWKP